MLVSFDTCSIWSVYVFSVFPSCAVIITGTSTIFGESGNVYVISFCFNFFALVSICTFAYSLLADASIFTVSAPARAVI